MGSANAPHLPWIETPLIESAALSKAAGCRIFLKLENLQPSGSFKSRGIGNLVLSTHLRDPTAPHHFYCPSGGNAGLACVVAARALGHPTTVVVPLTTSAGTIAKLRTAGAVDVQQVGASWSEANAHVREILVPRDPHGAYVPPFEHPTIWAGVASMAEEMSVQLVGVPDAVVCSVGGGGLLLGLAEGLERAYGTGVVSLVAVETLGADCLAKSVRAGRAVELESITSIATSLGTSWVSPKAVELALDTERVKSVVVNDAEAVMGCWRLAEDERLLVEPACGASVVMCFGGRLKKILGHLTEDSKVVICVCGGSNVSMEMLLKWKEEYGNRFG